MSTQQAALENLRVIRSLMEKAHIYRTVSGQAAVFGGLRQRGGHVGLVGLLQQGSTLGDASL